jgi:hypothetical protein
VARSSIALGTWFSVRKPFTAVIYEWSLKAGVFFHGKPFQVSEMFGRKVRAYPTKEP